MHLRYFCFSLSKWSFNSTLAFKTYVPKDLGINDSTTLNQIIEGGLLPPGGMIEFWINDNSAYGKEIRTAINNTFSTNFYGFCYIVRTLNGTTRFLKCIGYDSFDIYVNVYSEVNSVEWLEEWKYLH